MKFSTTFLLLGGDSLLGSAFARPPSVQQPLQTVSPTVGHEPTAQFESGEHNLIGDLVLLHYPGKTVNGSDFKYNISQKHGSTPPLSFGQLVTFGDYYGTYQVSPAWIPSENASQISDYWVSNMATGMNIFMEVLNLVRNNYRCDSCTDGYLPDLSNDVSEETQLAMKYGAQGGDVAQYYEDNFDSWYAAYSYDTTNAVTVNAW